MGDRYDGSFGRGKKYYISALMDLFNREMLALKLAPIQIRSLLKLLLKLPKKEEIRVIRGSSDP